VFPVVGDFQKELESSLADFLENCTQCKRCVRDCGFLHRYGDPFELAEQYQAGELPTDIILSCSLCRLCTAVCPEGLDPYRLLWLMRCMRSETGEVDYRRYRALLVYERIGLTKLFSLYDWPENATTVFFPGCALAGTRPEQFKFLLARLRQYIGDLGVVLSCCGKPSHDLGRVTFFAGVFRELNERLKSGGIETVLTACPSCQQVFKQYASGLEVKTVYEVLAEVWEGDSAGSGAEVRLHDPCNARFDKAAQDGVRHVLKTMGLRFQEMEHHGPKTFCCGEGGSVSQVDAGLADQWSNKREAEAQGNHLVTYCAGCTHFLGRLQPVSHIVDIIMDPQVVRAGRNPVSRSPMTYINRLRLKAFLRNTGKRS
jgi:Fe-S oxidoreductase